MGNLGQALTFMYDLTPTQVTPSASFTNDLGLDSLDAVEVVMAIEGESPSPSLGQWACCSVCIRSDIFGGRDARARRHAYTLVESLRHRMKSCALL